MKQKSAQFISVFMNDVEYRIILIAILDLTHHSYKVLITLLENS